MLTESRERFLMVQGDKGVRVCIRVYRTVSLTDTGGQRHGKVAYMALSSSGRGCTLTMLGFIAIVPHLSVSMRKSRHYSMAHKTMPR